MEIPGIKTALTAEEQHSADVSELARDLERVLDAECEAGRYEVVGCNENGYKLYRKVQVHSGT